MVWQPQRRRGGIALILLDTNVILRRIFEPAKLGRQTHQLLDQAWAVPDVAVSAITFWEVAMLHDKGRIAFTADVGLWRQELLAAGLREIPLDGVIGVTAGNLSYPKGDPADRIIIATALHGGHQLATADRHILNWPGPLNRIPAAD